MSLKTCCTCYREAPENEFREESPLSICKMCADEILRKAVKTRMCKRCQKIKLASEFGDHAKMCFQCKRSRSYKKLSHGRFELWEK